MSARNPNKRKAQNLLVLCPQCGAPDLETVQVKEAFDHGGRKKPIRVTALLPIKHCRKCDFSFEDWETEKARHRAACAEVGVQAPEDIQKLRLAYGLSQKEFARLTRLGGATLNRWERGHLIQNGAYDDYLYLLRYPENLERLRQRRPAAESDNKRFRCLQPTAELRCRAQRFGLTAARRAVGTGGSAERLEEKAEVNAGPVGE